jgi:putative ABC transport system permease protein
VGLGLRTSFRSLRRAPVFALAAILTLGLALGAVTTAFGLLYGSLDDRRFGGADQVVLSLTEDVAGQRLRMRWPYAAIRILREASPASLSRVASYTIETVNATADRDAARLGAEFVSRDYFAIARVGAALGRLPVAFDSESTDTPAEIAISDRLWRRAYAGAPGVLGRTLRVSRTPLTIVGVLPAGFAGLSGRADAWVAHAWAPLLTFPPYFTSDEYFHNVIAELAPAASVQDAQSELAVVGARVATLVAPRSNAATSRGLEVRTVAEARTDPAVVRARTYVAAGAVLVLLVAAVNLANLVAARLATRQRELVLRLALGAGRGQVFRVVLTELVLVAVCGLLAARALAVWTRDAVASLIPPGVPSPANDYAQLMSLADLRIDALLMTVVAGAAFLVVLFAAVLALRPILRGNIAVTLKRSGDRGSALAPARTQRTLLAAQIAMSLTLIALASLLLRSVAALESVDPGVTTDRILTFSVADHVDDRARLGGAGIDLAERLLKRIAAVPGVEAVTVGQCPPFGARCARLGLVIVGRPETEASPLATGWHRVGPDHFDVLGIPIIRGRGFTVADRRGRPPVVVINEAAVRHFFAGDDPIGRRIRLPDVLPGEPDIAEIVGVVGDVTYWPADNPPGPDVYQPALQFSHPWTTVIARVAAEPNAFVPAMRAAVAEVDPDLPIFDVAPLEELARAGRGDRRLVSTLITLCAVLGLILAAVGAYGLTAAWFESRRRELAVRAALGADPGALVRVALVDTLRQCGLGVVVGVALALLGGRLLQSLLFGVTPYDAISLASAVGATAAVTVGVSYLPARRARRVDPIHELNSE